MGVIGALVEICHPVSRWVPDVEVILDNTILYNNIAEIIMREYAIMNEIQSY